MRIIHLSSTARKYFFTLALGLALCCSLQAQDYKSALGLRFGYNSNLGLNFKTFLNDKSAIELIALGRSYTYYKFFDLSALYEIQNKFPDVSGLSWYYGGGGAVGIYSFDANFNGSQGTQLRVVGVLGLEYRIGGAPITLSLDWMPSYAITGGGGFFADTGGFAVRYIFK